MHARNPKRADARQSTSPLSADLALPGFPGSVPVPANALSGALAAALGTRSLPGPGSAGTPGAKPAGGARRPDEINKAPKPLAGANRTQSPRQGHK